jgi:hypothetical protein
VDGPLEPGGVVEAELRITAHVPVLNLDLEFPDLPENVIQGEPPRFHGRPLPGEDLRFPVSVRVPRQRAPLVARVQVESAAGRYWVSAVLPFDREERAARGRRFTESGDPYWEYQAASRPETAPLSPPPATAPNAIVLYGRFLYRDRLLDPGGFVHAVDADNPMFPIRFAEIELLDQNGNVLDSRFTDGNGSFSFTMEPGTGVFQVRVKSRIQVAGGHLIEVVASPTNPRIFTALSSQVVNPAQTTSLGDQILEPTGGGEPFNILDSCLNGMFLIQLLNGSLPVVPLEVYWNPLSGERTRFVRTEKAIYLGADESYDDPVILHEFGHYAAYVYSKDTNPGGTHFIDDTNQDPRLSWAEGFASYFQSAIRSWLGEAYPSWYIDTHGGSGQGQLYFAYDCEQPSLSVRGPGSEVVVHALLWEIEDGPTTPGDLTPGEDDDALILDRSDSWRVVAGPLVAASDVTLEDFWEGWFAIDNGFESEMEESFSSLGNEYYADTHEADDTPAAGGPLVLDGARSHHTFYPDGDVDHWYLDLTEGAPVSLETLNIQGFGDTNLEVRSPDSAVVAQNNNRASGDISSAVAFLAPVTGRYGVRVRRGVTTTQSSLLRFGSYDIRALSGIPHQPNLVLQPRASGVDDAGFGVGVAMADYDGDGYTDMYLVNNPGAGEGASRDVLFQNLHTLSFANRTALAGLGSPEGGIGAAWGDMDNDGDPDLFVTDHGLFENRGDGTFVDVTEASAVDDIGREFDAQWVDAEGDGRLDLFVVRRDGPSALWRNNGDGTFTDVAGEAGFAFPAGGNDAVSCAWGDYNRDGLPDLFMTFRGSRGQALYRNLGGNRFVDVTGIAGMASGTPASCGVWGDVDNDGWLDLFVAVRGTDRLYMNEGDGTFKDKAGVYGVNDPETAENAAFVDYDLDGDLDLYVVHVAAANALFENLGSTMIRTNQAVDTGTGFGCAWGDIDNDGDPDLYLARGCGVTCEQNRLYVNFSNVDDSRTWLKVRLEGVVSNRDGIGATVTVVSDGHSQIRCVGAGTAWASKSRIPELFGFPDGATLDSVVVEWPSGVKDIVRQPKANRTLTVTENNVTPVLPGEPTPFGVRLTPASPNPFRSATALVLVLESRAPVRAEIFDLSGRRVRRLIDRDLEAGSHVAGWDGRDDSGRATAPGIYFYRLTVPGRFLTRKLVRLSGN